MMAFINVRTLLKMVLYRTFAAHFGSHIDVVFQALSVVIMGFQNAWRTCHNPCVSPVRRALSGSSARLPLNGDGSFFSD
jgi:hypothetical protein